MTVFEATDLTDILSSALFVVSCDAGSRLNSVIRYKAQRRTETIVSCDVQILGIHFQWEKKKPEPVHIRNIHWDENISKPPMIDSLFLLRYIIIYLMVLPEMFFMRFYFLFDNISIRRGIKLYMQAKGLYTYYINFVPFFIDLFLFDRELLCPDNIEAVNSALQY